MDNTYFKKLFTLFDGKDVLIWKINNNYYLILYKYNILF